MQVHPTRSRRLYPPTRPNGTWIIPIFLFNAYYSGKKPLGNIIRKTFRNGELWIWAFLELIKQVFGILNWFFGYNLREITFKIKWPDVLEHFIVERKVPFARPKVVIGKGRIFPKFIYIKVLIWVKINNYSILQVWTPTDFEVLSHLGNTCHFLDPEFNPHLNPSHKNLIFNF